MVELCVPTKANDYNPPVVSKYLRERGQTRGIRLIPFDAFVEYINGCE